MYILKILTNRVELHMFSRKYCARSIPVLGQAAWEMEGGEHEVMAVTYWRAGCALAAGAHGRGAFRGGGELPY